VVFRAVGKGIIGASRSEPSTHEEDDRMGGFRSFLTKTNALALAIGVIIGVALGSVVTTLVNAIIMPPIGWLLGSVDFASIKTVLGTNAKGEQVSIGWGLFLNSLIVFVVVMLVVYIISKLFIKEAPPPGPSAEEVLLTEIRDELRKRPI
jgi:large conductance mechanosensitive channel